MQQGQVELMGRSISTSPLYPCSKAGLQMMVLRRKFMKHVRTGSATGGVLTYGVREVSRDLVAGHGIKHAYGV
jgi:hypothetical protein